MEGNREFHVGLDQPGHSQLKRTRSNFFFRKTAKPLPIFLLAVSYRRDPKYKTYSFFWVALQLEGLILILIPSNNKIQKTILSANVSLGERILKFGLCLSWHPKWVFHIDTLWEAICIVLEIHFEFGFCNESPVDDSQLPKLEKTSRPLRRTGQQRYPEQLKQQNKRLCQLLKNRKQPRKKNYSVLTDLVAD